MRDDVRAGHGHAKPYTIPADRAVAVGRHCIMEFHQCTSEILNDRGAVEDTLRAGVRTGNLTMVQLLVHAFAPHGLTAVAVLQESHLVLHTWPELGFVAADLFTCGDEGDPQRVCAAFVDALRPRQYAMRCFEREAVVEAALSGESRAA